MLSFWIRVSGGEFLVLSFKCKVLVQSWCRVPGAELVKIWIRNPGKEFLVHSAIEELVQSPAYRVGSDLVHNSGCRVSGAKRYCKVCAEFLVGGAEKATRLLWRCRLSR